MLNLIGGNRVYTVKEIDQIISTKTGFFIVDELPDADTANSNLVYYRRTDKLFEDEHGHLQKVLRQYIVGEDPEFSGHKAWFTTDATGGATANSYNALSNLPSINGEKILGDIDAKRAKAPVSTDGISGGYDMSIHDDDIIDIVTSVIGPQGDNNLHPIGR